MHRVRDYAVGVLAHSAQLNLNNSLGATQWSRAQTLQKYCQTVPLCDFMRVHMN